MSFNRVVLPLILVTLVILTGCSSSSGPVPVPPPGGGFSNSNLNGTYVFSVSGVDQANGNPYAIVGTFTANGSGGITGGTVDINDAGFATSTPVIAPIADAPINASSSSYSVGVDGRGKVILNTSTAFGTIILDLVLQDSSHGLVSEFDENASGSGTLDAQSAAVVTPSGTYAFSFGGADETTEASLSTVGNFTVGSGAITGLEDFNDGGLAYTDGGPGYVLNGTLVLGPSSTPGTTLNTAFLSGSQTYDVYAIDATHLKFIEMDAQAILSGDAFSQTSTTIPAATFTFTLGGEFGTGSSAAPSAGGGFMVTDGNGNITSASTLDVNEGGTTISSQPLTFTGTYAASGTGRFLLSELTSFLGTTYVAYPYSAGLFLLEVDNVGGMSGAAYPQSSTSLSSSAGYGLNLTGVAEIEDTVVEVDDIAEFANSSSTCGTLTGTFVSGITDENYAPGGGPSYDISLCGAYSAPDSNGRGEIVTTANTLNGGYALNFYTVDGTTFPFIEMDQTQISMGAFVVQNASGSSAAAARSHLFLVRPVVRAHAALRRQKQK